MLGRKTRTESNWKKHMLHTRVQVPSIEMEHRLIANPKQIHSIHSHGAMPSDPEMQMGPVWDVRRWDMNRALTDAFSAALPSDT